jgi:toxin-antitoxin system PIN domain toxin
VNHLLDVNALIALVWPSHVHHARAVAWVKGRKIAVCPITELGFVRVSTSPGFGASMADARKALADFLKDVAPAFIPADTRALDGAITTNSKMTTDFYLANLAAKHGLKLATFDTDIKHTAVEQIN